MDNILRKICVGVFFLACSYTLQANTLSQRLWSELDIAKAPIETNPSEITPESKNQEELSPADLAFMEAEFQEDSISTSLAAPVRDQQKVKESKEYNESSEQALTKTRFRSRGREKKTPIRERSR